MSFTLEEIKQLPKTDLHVHLDGSVRLESLIDFANKMKIELPSYTKEGLKDLVFKNSYKDLPEYLKCFEYLCASMQDLENIEQASYEFALDAFLDGVYHIEPRYCPSLLLNEKNTFSIKEVILAVEKGLSHAAKLINEQISGSAKTEKLFSDYPFVNKAFTYTQILCIMRHWSPENSYKYIEELINIKKSSEIDIRNIDLAGPENGFPVSLHQKAFDLSKGMNKTIHAGEADGPESIYSAIKLAGAKRIGHGVNLFNKEYNYGDNKTAELINIIKDNDITIEVCLTSNLQTLPELEMKAENHSLIKMLEAGINISPSTDNRTVSNTTVSEELFKIQSAFKLDKDTVLSLIKNGFKARFHE